MMTLDEQVAALQAEYDQAEAAIKADLGETALDTGAWVDLARSTADYAGPDITEAARTEWQRRQGLDRHRGSNPAWWEAAIAGTCSHGGHGWDGDTCSDAPGET